MSRKRLADDVRLDVDFEDETPFGAALGGGADDALRRSCAEISPLTAPRDMNALVRDSKELLARAFERDLATRYLRPGVLREECLFPPADRVWPRALLATRGAETLVAIGVERSALGELAPFISEFQRGTERPTSVVGRALFDLLEGSGALVDDDREEREPAPGADVVFVGHATVMLGREVADRVLVDPFLLPTSPAYPESYQPLRVTELLPTAVVITHSHPDHFDPGSLLRLGADTPIYVPHVERESLLAVDMAMRLEQLGFSRVTRVRPGDEITIGRTKVHALPFFGEQPTTGECLHPEVRNVGCTYSFVSPERHVFLVADAGRDRDGDVRDLAALVRRRWGAPDVLLGGYRGFALYPIQWLFSSVARYLLFVPEAERAVRQVTMNDCDGLLDTAERSGARQVVPYADGGAPWYWERGLGPRLDGHGTPNPSADPPPAEVLRRAARRSSWGDDSVASPSAVSIVRPGECVRIGQDGASRVEPYLGRTWPYARLVWHQHNVALKRTLDGSALPSARSVFRALEPVLAAWRSEGRLRHFFFMRKPPDLRLRFFGVEGLRDELSALVRGLVEAGDIERAYASEYEPETDRFGGPRAMDAVHAWFDVDTSAWMRLDALESSGAPSVQSSLLTCAVASDLVSRVLRDRAEAWAMWRAYASQTGLGAEDAGGELLTPVDIEMLKSAAGPDVRRVLERYREANRTLAEELTGLVAGGELSAGMRSVLVAFVMFHLNRYGLDAGGHARLAWSMIRDLDPAIPA